MDRQQRPVLFRVLAGCIGWIRLCRPQRNAKIVPIKPWQLLGGWHIAGPRLRLRLPMQAKTCSPVKLAENSPVAASKTEVASGESTMPGTCEAGIAASVAEPTEPASLEGPCEPRLLQWIQEGCRVRLLGRAKDTVGLQSKTTLINDVDEIRRRPFPFRIVLSYRTTVILFLTKQNKSFFRTSKPRGQWTLDSGPPCLLLYSPICICS